MENPVMGIELLSFDEIELVSGGKASSPPTKSLWERICDWFSGFLDGGGAAQPSTPSGGITITGDQLIEMQHDCVTHGGSFSISGGTSGGGASVVFVNAWGETSSINIQCIQ